MYEKDLALNNWYAIKPNQKQKNICYQSYGFNIPV